ncbi:MAG: hypothetical protein GWP32_04520 [Bacteroidetes bacterium]|nr:hypothetical protein [Bacteroidota bacterium]
MKNKRLKRISLATLILGYLASGVFISLIAFNSNNKTEKGQQTSESSSLKVIEQNKTKIVYTNVLPAASPHLTKGYREAPVHEKLRINKNNSLDIYHEDNYLNLDQGGNDILELVGDKKTNNRNKKRRDQIMNNERVDPGLLDRRLATLDDDELIIIDNDDDLVARLDKKDIGLDRGGNDNVNVGNFVPDARSGDFDDDELGAVGNFDKDGAGFGKGTMPGVGKGAEVYAYNFPSQGVGAGIGSPAVGAAAGFAGLGAGIGQAVMDGQAVPALGGIGTYSPPTKSEGSPKNTSGSVIMVAPGVAGGVAGLVGGAGAGAAAGLSSARASLPITVANNIGYGGGAGSGYNEGNYDHLPKDGNLYIMMHVDGRGSILSTRKALDEMKNTLLKNALLPYYKNDEDLYNRRVLIVDGEGERTLKFFADAAKKENVLALVFQDEAQPAYHLPNFNRKPEDHYMDDLNDLKEGLNGYGGLYRGIMFQVDRGKTFAKSFKEFVENAWRGDGYLSGAGENLKPYYWQENSDNIRNRDGIVFSDEYHVNSEGDPAYYMNLIINASQKIGLNLKRYNGEKQDSLK